MCARCVQIEENAAGRLSGARPWHRNRNMWGESCSAAFEARLITVNVSTWVDSGSTAFGRCFIEFPPPEAQQVRRSSCGSSSIEPPAQLFQVSFVAAQSATIIAASHVNRNYLLISPRNGWTKDQQTVFRYLVRPKNFRGSFGAQALTSQV
jgi:hypothetical protein